MNNARKGNVFAYLMQCMDDKTVFKVGLSESPWVRENEFHLFGKKAKMKRLVQMKITAILPNGKPCPRVDADLSKFKKEDYMPIFHRARMRAKKLEDYFKHRYRSKRVQGKEWFRLDAKDLLDIKRHFSITAASYNDFFTQTELQWLSQ